MKTRVFTLLKPKVVSLGFAKEEIEGVVDNLARTLQEDATDEQISQAIENVLPYLKVSQTAVNRIVNAKKETDPDPNNPNPTNPKPGGVEGEPEWFKQYREKTEAEIASLKSANTIKDRRSLYEASLEGLLPSQKADKLATFERLAGTFKDDADFNSFMETEKASVKAIMQELENKGLEDMSVPRGGGSSRSEEDDFIRSMETINKPTTD